MALLLAELCQWERFGNRRKLASYTGLTGGVSDTGNRHVDLAITKHGNKRVRHLLIQLAWRMVVFQSQSVSVQKWKHILLNPKAHARLRKRAIVALARQLVIDLWAWQTGRKTPTQLGWIMTEA
jgi:transposase